MSTAILTVIKSMRPPFLVLAPICALLGIAMASALHDSLNILHVVLAIVGGIAAHISANAFNEYFDFKSGLDTLTEKTPFSGGSGSLPDNPGALGLVLISAVISLLITCAIGLYLLLSVSQYLLPIGVVGVVVIIAYTQYINKNPWLCLIAPGLAFGPLFVFGSYISVVKAEWVSQTAVLQVFWASLLPFFLVNNLLLLNQLPDVEADRQVGRRTLPIGYGKPLALNVYLLFWMLAVGVVVLSPLVFGCSLFILLALLPLALGLKVFIGVKESQFRLDKMIPFLGQNVVCTLVSTLIFALALLLAT